MIVVAYLADLGEQLLPTVICSVAVRETFWRCVGVAVVVREMSWEIDV